ncbi:MAG: prepilin peptidase [Eubacterium sp.]|nr:prepilin peptidase [Eubacterium sp.]
MELIIDVGILVYLLCMGVIDIRKKSIPIWPGVVCLLLASVTRLVIGVSPVRLALGIGVGVLLYGVSRVSRGGIGEADALVYAVTGAAIGVSRNLEVLLVSLLLAAIVGGALLVIKKVGLKYKMPFVPFVCVSYGMVMLL